MEMGLGMSEAEAYNTGSRGTQGDQMKNDFGWASSNGTNSSGFSGLPGGFRNPLEYFSPGGNLGYWWSSAPPDVFPTFRMLNSMFSVWRNSLDVRTGCSVRCILDAE